MEQLLAVSAYYLVIGGIGVLVLIVSIIFGDLFEAFDAPFEAADGWLSTQAIAGAMAFFGLAGVILSGVIPEPFTLVLAIVMSIAAFAAVASVMRFMHSQQGSVSVSRESFYAQHGVVTQRIPAEKSGSGEIQITIPGSGIITLEAYTSTSTPLPVDTKVVIHRVEPRMVHVIPLDDPETEFFNA